MHWQNGLRQKSVCRRAGIEWDRAPDRRFVNLKTDRPGSSQPPITGQTTPFQRRSPCETCRGQCRRISAAKAHRRRLGHPRDGLLFWVARNAVYDKGMTADFADETDKITFNALTTPFPLVRACHPPAFRSSDVQAAFNLRSGMA
jgi:hypothetical protein